MFTYHFQRIWLLAKTFWKFTAATYCTCCCGSHQFDFPSTSNSFFQIVLVTSLSNRSTFCVPFLSEREMRKWISLNQKHPSTPLKLTMYRAESHFYYAVTLCSFQQSCCSYCSVLQPWFWSHWAKTSLILTICQVCYAFFGMPVHLSCYLLANKCGSTKYNLSYLSAGLSVVPPYLCRDQNQTQGLIDGGGTLHRRSGHMVQLLFIKNSFSRLQTADATWVTFRGSAVLSELWQPAEPG